MCIQTVSVFALMFTLWFYYRQIVLMRLQLDETKRGATAENVISLIGYLQADDVREARTFVITKLRDKDIDNWSEEEKYMASKICSSYASAAVVLQTKFIPLQPFIENWGPSVQICYKILEAFIQDLRKSENAGPNYWKPFDWLYQQTIEAKL